MLQASRSAIIGLLALMQLFAPLVHAHTGGGGQFAGAIHIPGLEFLAKTHGKSAQAPVGQGEGLDVVVVPASGLKNQGVHAIPASDVSSTLPTLSNLATGSPGRHPAFLALQNFPLSKAAWLQPSPRAPPRLA